MSMQRIMSRINRFNQQLRLPCVGEVDSATGDIIFRPTVAAVEVKPKGVTSKQSCRDVAMLAVTQRKNRGPTPVKAKGDAADSTGV